MSTKQQTNVIVSVTTIPSRCAKIAMILENVMEQTYPFDVCYVYVPERCTRLQDAPYKLTPELEQIVAKANGRIMFRNMKEDFGPGSKLIPALEEYLSVEKKEEDNVDTVIISIDDDILLEKHALEELVAAHKQLPNYILGFIGTYEVNKQTFFVHAEHKWYSDFCKVDGLGGYRGVLYPVATCQNYPKLFHGLHNAHLKNLGIPVLDDDHAFRLCAIHENIIRMVVRTKYPVPEAANQIVPGLNIVFLECEDGVSHPSAGPMGRLAISRAFIDSWFLDNLH